MATKENRVPAPVRLRSAGFGVIVGGLALGVLSVLLPYSVAAGTLLVAAIALGVAGRSEGTWLFQLCLGIGAVGAIGLAETLTSAGIGLGPGQLAALAVVFGVLDVVIGGILHRFTAGTHQG